jgi:hypothetical protein
VRVVRRRRSSAARADRRESMSETDAPVREPAPARERASTAGTTAVPAQRSHDDTHDETHAHDRAATERPVDPGGLSIAAVFFGWLVSVALPALSVAVTGIGAAVAGASMDVTRDDAREQAQAIGLAGGLLLVLFVLLGHFAGGYVAGRMTRSGAVRHGVGVWVFGLLAGIVATVAGVVVTTGYGLNERLGLSTASLPESAFDSRGVFAFACLLLTTLLAAVLGGRAGRGYHGRTPHGRTPRGRTRRRTRRRAQT